MVLVPGLCGSRLVCNELVAWPCLAAPLASLSLLRWPNKAVTADEVIAEWDVAGLLRFSTGYGRLRKALTQQLGYRLGEDLVEFAYDWRQDCRRSAAQLRARVDAWKRGHPGDRPRIVVLAHSMGGLVARYWIERLGGAADVAMLVLIGSPLAGTPSAFEWLVQGGPFPFRNLSQKISAIIQTMPAVYQLLPQTPFVFTSAGASVDIFTQRDWIPSRYHGLLDDGRAFHAELGQDPSVPTLTVIGHGVETPAQVFVDLHQREPWLDARVERDDQGDGLIPVASARLAGSKEQLVDCDHEALLTHECLLRLLDARISLGNHTPASTHREDPLSAAA